MKPYPRSPLKNLTVPVIAIGKTPVPWLRAADPHGAAAGSIFAIPKAVTLTPVTLLVPETEATPRARECQALSG